MCSGKEEGKRGSEVRKGRGEGKRRRGMERGEGKYRREKIVEWERGRRPGWGLHEKRAGASPSLV